MLAELERLRAGLADKYQIEREIGSGGMAYVFLAQDLKHNRKVAVKVLKPELASRVGAKRFLREIQLTAALQHPHILPLFDSGEANGFLYSVAPFVAGETLRGRLEREQQLPLEEALALICTVANALDYAHHRGVIHRDIKPENILLLDGEVSVADFGIAIDLGSIDNDRITSTGLSVGTPRYMSPEQASGERVIGAQSDIYSLAAVAYEMLAGEPPITGPSTKAIVARLLTETPRPIRTIRDTVPSRVEAVILKALAKTPADRFRNAAEFSAALRNAGSDVARHSTGKALTRGQTFRLVTALAVLALLVTAGLAWVRSARTSIQAPRPVAKKITFTGLAIYPAISPNGEMLAYLAQGLDSQRVLVQSLAGGPPDTVAAFGEFGGANSMEWSPDGNRLLIASAKNIVILPRRGGPVRTLQLPAVEGPAFAYWLPDGRVSMHGEMSKRLLIVDLGSQDTLTVPIRRSFRTIWEGSWSPDGRLFALLNESTNGRWQIWTIALDGKAEILVEDTVNLNSPRWSADGQSVYYARGINSIMRVSISPRSQLQLAAPEEIISGLEALPAFLGLVRFSVSKDGMKLVYAKGDRFSNLFRVEPAGPEKPPRVHQLTRGTALRYGPTISPDGLSIAFVEESSGASEIVSMPISGGQTKALTMGARVWPRSQIAWSPDGTQIAFGSVRDGRGKIWIATVNTGELRRFERSSFNTMTGHVTWAPGSRIAYQRPNTMIALLDPLTGDETLLSEDTTGFYHFPRYSPLADQMVVVRQEPSERPHLSIFSIRDRVETKLPGGLLFPRGWSTDGRYIFAQDPVAPRLFRVESSRQGTRTLLFSSPVREMECAPTNRVHRNQFICAFLDFVSDIWMIDHFDPRGSS